MDQVVVLGDYLRVNDDGFTHQWLPIKQLHALVSGPISRVTGQAVLRRYSNFSSRPNAWDFAKEIFAAYDLPNVAASWSQIYWRTYVPNSLIELFKEEFSNQILISFETPPILETAYKEAGIEFIDIRVHYIRFLSDIIFAFRHFPRTTSLAMNVSLPAWRVSQNVIGAHVGATKASNKRLINNPDFEGALFFLGQVPGDASLLKPEGFISDDEIISFAQETLTKTGRKLVIRPHPLDKANLYSSKLKSAFPGAMVHHGNFYELLAEDADMEFAAYSSGGLHEAEIFGHKIHRQCEIPLCISNQVEMYYVPVLQSFLYENFWRSVLHGDACVEIGHPIIPNLVRNAY